MVRRIEHERPGYEQARIGSGEFGGFGRPLGDRDVARFLHEPAERRHGDGVFVDPEPVHLDLVNGRFLRVEVVRSHREDAAGDLDHPFHLGVLGFHRHLLDTLRAGVRPTPCRGHRTLGHRQQGTWPIMKRPLAFWASDEERGQIEQG